MFLCKIWRLETCIKMLVFLSVTIWNRSELCAQLKFQFNSIQFIITKLSCESLASTDTSAEVSATPCPIGVLSLQRWGEQPMFGEWLIGILSGWWCNILRNPYEMDFTWWHCFTGKPSPTKECTQNKRTCVGKIRAQVPLKELVKVATMQG